MWSHWFGGVEAPMYNGRSTWQKRLLSSEQRKRGELGALSHHPLSSSLVTALLWKPEADPDALLNCSPTYICDKISPLNLELPDEPHRIRVFPALGSHTDATMPSSYLGAEHPNSSLHSYAESILPTNSSPAPTLPSVGTSHRPKVPLPLNSGKERHRLWETLEKHNNASMKRQNPPNPDWTR